MKLQYNLKIEHIGSSPFILKLHDKGYKREIGFYKMEELDTYAEFIIRESDSFLKTVKNYPKNHLNPIDI